MQETSSLSSSHDSKDGNEDIPMHGVAVSDAPPTHAKPSNTPQDDHNEGHIPDAILLEIHVPLPSSTIV